jgi:hypothetical protein
MRNQQNFPYNMMSRIVAMGVGLLVADEKEPWLASVTQ